MACKKCGAHVPEARLRMGYTECTKCSTVQPYGCVHIISDKTGNDIQILPAKLAQRANRYAQRNGFGVLKAMEDTRKGTTQISYSED